MVKSDFRSLTDALFVRVGAEELAEKIGCSVQAVRQARTAQDSLAFRSAPAGYSKAVENLARERAAYFTRLANRAATASD